LSAISLLAKMMETGADRLPLQEYSTCSGFDSLEEVAVVEEAEILRSVLCEECGRPHEAHIIYSDARNSYGWTCYDVGFVPINVDRLRSVRVSPRKLVSLLAQALNCKGRRSRPLAENTLWKVGFFNHGGETISVYLAARKASLEDARRWATVIASEPNRRYRVLITPELEELRDFRIGECRTVKIDDVVSMTSDKGLTVEAQRLAEIAGVPVRRRGGRPSPYQPKLGELVEKRVLTGQAEKGVKAEAREILSLWASPKTSLNAPSPRTVERAISAYRTKS